MLAEHISNFEEEILSVSIQDKTGCTSLDFLNAGDMPADVGVPYCTCVIHLMRGRTMAALELDKLEVTVYVYHENTCTFGGVYVTCIYTHAR